MYLLLLAPFISQAQEDCKVPSYLDQISSFELTSCQYSEYNEYEFEYQDLKDKTTKLKKHTSEAKLRNSHNGLTRMSPKARLSIFGNSTKRMSMNIIILWFTKLTLKTNFDVFFITFHMCVIQAISGMGLSVS